MSATLTALKSKFGDAVVSTSEDFGDQSAVVEAAKLVEIATWLRDEARFDMPLFVTCIDRMGQPDRVRGLSLDEDDPNPRFEVVYQLRSMASKETVRIKVMCGDEPKCPSLTGLWRGLNWLERECFDMYGVDFEGHPDLRRIYMYEEFVGHPLRKDYPKEKRQPLVRREWTDEVTDITELGGQ